jgi:hypothetical protein
MAIATNNATTPHNAESQLNALRDQVETLMQVALAAFGATRRRAQPNPKAPRSPHAAAPEPRQDRPQGKDFPTCASAT